MTAPVPPYADPTSPHPEGVTDEVARAVAAERERCARVVETWSDGDWLREPCDPGVAALIRQGEPRPEGASGDARLKVLQTAVHLCIGHNHGGDIGTLKRAWFYSHTGRDEPVGGWTWAALLAEVAKRPPPRRARRAPSMGDAARRKAQSFVAEIDEAELTLRIAEIGIGAKRPLGLSAQQALATLEANVLQAGDVYALKVMADFRKMAREAVRYFSECITAGSNVS